MHNIKPIVVWISANRFGYEILETVMDLRIVSVSAIITLAEESKTIMYDGISVGNWQGFGIPVLEVKNISDGEYLLRNLAPDFIFSCGWRQILTDTILSIPRQGVVGFHPTLLPRGRGPAPLINSIMEGLHESGITMFYVSSDVDAGDIIGQEKFTIEMDDTVGVVYEKAIRSAKILIKKFLPLLAKSTAPRMPQDHDKATYFKRRTLEDNKILDTDSADMVYRKIRALSEPYRGAFILRGGKKVRIWRATVDED